jgi:hypothetical protein
MGYHIHHTITVSSWHPDAIEAFSAYARSIGASVSSACVSDVNGRYSCLVGPDGSKEGWEESDVGDKRRAQIKVWLRAHAPYSWFEAEHPEDSFPRVIDHDRKRVRV